MNVICKTFVVRTGAFGCYNERVNVDVSELLKHGKNDMWPISRL